MNKAPSWGVQTKPSEKEQNNLRYTMDFDPSFAGYIFPVLAPGATPTTGNFNHNVLQTPKTATFPSHFQDAFSTPQTHSYAIPQQPQYALMSPIQGPPSSADTLRSNYYAHVQAHGHQAVHPPPQVGPQHSVISPGQAHGFQPSPMQDGSHGSFDSNQMQTPPPTRGTSFRKSQQPVQVAFGTPSTIASRRFLQTPQQPALQSNLAADQQHTPVQFPQLQFSPDMYQHTNMGPASAPVMPQTQLLWAQMQSPHAMVQPSPLGDPFGSTTTQQMQWPAPSPVQQEMAQIPPFSTPAMTSFSVQPPHPRPASAVPLAQPQQLFFAVPATSASLDPSLIYSSPVRPIVRSSSRSSRSKPQSLAAGSKRKDSDATSQQPRDSTSPTTSITDISGPGLRRSNTTGTTKAQPVQQSLRPAEPLSRSNSFTQVPRTTSPLKRVGRTPLGRISERNSKRASVILTVDENGMARTQTLGAEPESPTKSIRNRYPGLFDSDTEEDDSDTSEEPRSRSTSSAFARNDERKSKAARLDPPVENLEGIDLPRSSSRASSKGVTPSRAAIAAAAQLRKQSSVRRTSRNASIKRNPMTSSTASLNSLIDSAPMDVGMEPQQAKAGSMRFTRADLHPHHDWATITPAPPKRQDLQSQQGWTAMSLDHQPITPQNQSSYVGGFRPAYTPMQPPPMLVRCICGVETDRGRYKQLTTGDVEALAPAFSDAPQYNSDAMIDYECETKKLISTLPSHLKNAHPWLSGACGLHKYLNTILIDDLWRAILHDINQETKEIWQPLNEQGKLTPAQQYYFEHFHEGWYTPYMKCSGCCLMMAGQNYDLLTVIGAITQATLSSRHWKKSRRLYFLECLMRGRVARHHADGAVRKMFNLGVQFRTLREDFLSANANGQAIDEAVAKYQTGRTGQVENPKPDLKQAPKHKSLAAEVSNTLSTFFDPGSMPGATTVQPPPVPPMPPVVNRKPVPTRPATRPETFREPSWPSAGQTLLTPNAEITQRVSQHNLREDAGLGIVQPTPVVSSVYSQGTDGDWEDFDSNDEAAPSPLTPRPAIRNTEIIEMYQYPRQDQTAEASSSAPMARPSTPHPEAGRTLKPRFSQLKLAPIWVPRDRYGDKNDQDPPKTSVLWKRRMSQMPVSASSRDTGGEVGGSERTKDAPVPGDAGDALGWDGLYGSDRWI
ncbi:hypothetical protein EJ03DRAFT_382696, partial [Teratosphaeria nubilosa]